MTTTTTSMAIAALLSLSIVAPGLAAEDVTEHETYEKRTMKIETLPTPPAPPAPTRVYEHHDESTVERRTVTPPPAAVVKERTTDSVEIERKN